VPEKLIGHLFGRVLANMGYGRVGHGNLQLIESGSINLSDSHSGSKVKGLRSA
jgi:hypothetical protein